MKFLKITISFLTLSSLIFNWNLVGAVNSSGFSADVRRANEPEYWGRTDDTDLDLTADVSIFAWINASSTAGGGQGWNGIVAKGTHATGYDFHYLTEDGARFRVFQGGANILTGSNAITNGTWYFVGYTCDDAGGAGSAQFYFNGTATTSGTCTANNNNTLDFRVGSTDAGTSRNWDGIIADVRVWSRVLSTTEVDSLKNNPCDFANGANLEGMWRFTEGTGTNADSEDPNDNDLTGVNTPAWSPQIPYTCTETAAAAAPAVIPPIWFE